MRCRSPRNRVAVMEVMQGVPDGCTPVPESTIHYADTGAACGHGACVTCWKTWVDSQLPACPATSRSVCGAWPARGR